MGLPEERRADRYLTRLPRRRLVTLLVTTLLLGAAGGFALGALGTFGRSEPVAGVVPARGAGTTSRAHAAPECTSAVARVNESLSYAVKIARAFVEQSRVVELLGRQQITVQRAVESGRQAAAKGGDASARFDEALAGYLRVVDSCQLDSP